MANYKIIWKGNDNTNKSTRRGHAPKVIVDHITEGSAKSTINWFTSSGNTVSSAHFLVTKSGEIYQFVKIEENAWANGINSYNRKYSTASIVKEMGVNPNWYSVSIEHEGIHRMTQGKLTDKQLAATIWLHQYIIDYVKRKWDVDIPLDRKHILGHYEIDPRRKPNCPGEKYPFNQIIQALNNKNTLTDIKGHWAEQDINEVVLQGIMSGYPNGEFKPDEKVSRAELATVIARLLKKEV
ncbi:N-acetylmuramoyl-L-alanine amidase [Vallitalea guaymasensis]|uniref:N-acetylmuramoyl-L-alanine amidase n=1 Tax=Vallitalea guaymasensis TaxID=1185412 RepID=UPI00272B0EAF|nr:N-acetylmuramoyl-L-alanine amidase [Vallitalea guaymasensis]